MQDDARNMYMIIVTVVFEIGARPEHLVDGSPISKDFIHQLQEGRNACCFPSK